MNHFSTRLAGLLFLILTQFHAKSQFKSSTSIMLDLQRFRSPYRVLYLAAHPDDENTRLISYLTTEEKAQTAYLSLTRGDGGQNLIGDEKGVLLGVLRTEELMAARRLDGALQFFTRAVDFGYSKTSDETFDKWGKEQILNDVVFIIRHYKPHLIINRFPPQNYAGHGHHQASAILSEEAFETAADPDKFNHPDSLPFWQTGTLYVNSSSWWDKNLPERAKNDNHIIRVDIGSYNEMTGYSYSELAALSRSQHKSQGFGSAMSRGTQMEYLEYLKGQAPSQKLFHPGLLDDIDQRWLALQPQIDSAISKFDFLNPAEIIEDLLALRKEVVRINSRHGRFNQKLQELDQIIASCCGLHLDLAAKNDRYCKYNVIQGTISVLNRSEVPVMVKSLNVAGTSFSWNRPLEENVTFEDTFALEIPKDATYSVPYWLQNSYGNTFNHQPRKLTTPDHRHSFLNGTITLRIGDTDLSLNRQLVYQWSDRVKGGLEKQVEIIPEVSVRFDARLYFPENGEINGKLVVRSNSDDLKKAKVILGHSSEIFVEMADSLMLPKKGSVVTVPFRINLKEGFIPDPRLTAAIVIGTDSFQMREEVIDYDHIRPQTVFLPAEASVVAIGKHPFKGRIAYIEGPDNEMVEFLKRAGCDITTFTEADLISNKLNEYDAVLFGIRSLNVNPDWNKYAEQFKNFMKKGGLVVVQYQTNRGVDISFKPYPFEISRNRVTNEDAVPNFLDSNHPVLNQPYKLGTVDFGGWNQERGLYFADKWDSNYKTVISWFDDGESADAGALIIGEVGKGAFIYTGISFFRHLPEGVPGSYKLLINLLSYKYKGFDK